MIASRLAVGGLTLLMVGPPVAWWQNAPWPLVLGSALATAAPLFFIVAHLHSSARLDHHPIAVSILSGLGCVTVMVGDQRFGSAPEWPLYTAAISLLTWMLWQRSERRRRREA